MASASRARLRGGSGRQIRRDGHLLYRICLSNEEPPKGKKQACLHRLVVDAASAVAASEGSWARKLRINCPGEC
jgi:hypothetical protein